MPDYSIFDTDAAAQDALVRLAHLIPHAEKLFAEKAGEPRNFRDTAWFKVAGLFSEADHVTARLATSGVAPPTPWILDYALGRHDLAKMHETVWCTSFDAAMAIALESCRDGKFWPDEMRFDERTREHTAYYHGEPLFRVFPMPIRAPVRVEALKRARSTLVGLRTAKSPRLELEKRMRRWPGASRLKMDPGLAVEDRAHYPHLPVPAEWLLSAEMLLEPTGLPVDLNAKQLFVSRMLGAKDYNTLIRGTADNIASLSGPWAVRQYNESAGLGVIDVFPDPFGAFEAFMRILSERSTLWNEPSMSETVWSSAGGLAITVRDRPWDHVAATSLHSEEIIFGQLHHASPEDESSVEAVKSAMRMPAEETDKQGLGMLEDLFNIPLSPKERLASHIAHAGWRPIARHGRWHIFDRADDDDRPAGSVYMSVVRTDDMGNVLSSVGLHSYKGGLAYVDEIKAWVFFSDYDYTCPVACIDELPASAVRAIQTKLLHSQGDFKRYRDYTATLDASGHRDLSRWREQLTAREG